jgi:predicted RNase H-like HicB family nuclease
MKLKFTVVIQKEDDWFVAKCIENSVVSQGKSMEEALDNLREALLLFFEGESPEINDIPTFITTLELAI